MAALAPSAPRAPRAGPGAYWLAVAVSTVAILSQYALPQSWPALRPVYANLVGELAIVYGIPVLVFAVLVGRAPLAHAFTALDKATTEGLRWYGLLSLLALFVTFLLAVVYLRLDPSALPALGRPNPDIQAASADPWFWIGFSFAIGAVEETIFRGWIFGFWLGRDPVHWQVPAIGSTLLFTGIHLYYATTYGVAAGLVYPMLFLIGLAFALTYRASGGNLLVVALLHGAFDSAAFLYLVSPTAGYALRYGLLLVGLATAALVYRRRQMPSASVTHL